MQQHPGVVANVQSKLRSLAGSYGYLRKSAGQMNLTASQQAVYMGQLAKTYQQMRVAAGARTSTTIRMMNNALKATTKQLTTTTKTTGLFNKIFQRMGYRMSWVGFRLSIMGRMIMRSMIAPMQSMVGVLNNWEKSMETVALALALQEAGMGETGLSAEELNDTLLSLANTGMTVKTALGGLQSTWIALSETNAPNLISILGTLQDILEGVGGEIITSLVDTIEDALPWIGDMVSALEPWTGVIGLVLGAFLLLSPAMLAIGTAVFLLKPTLMALQWALDPVVVALVGAIVLVELWKQYWGDWVGYMENVVFPIFDRLAGLLPFWDPFKMIGGGLEVLGGLAGGAPPAGGETTQEIDVDVSIDIENILSEIDLDAMVEKVNEAVAEALRQRAYG